MLDSVATPSRAGSTFKIHVEIHVRPKTDAAQQLPFFDGADYLNFPRRPDVNKHYVRLANPVQVPTAAVKRLETDLDRSAMARLCPHLTGYDYPEDENGMFSFNLRSFYDYGIRTVLLVKGDPLLAPSQETLTTLEMLKIARNIMQSEAPSLELAVAGQLPKDEDWIRLEFEYLNLKIEAGASVVLTQPVHSLRSFERYCRLLEDSKLHQRASFRPGVALWSGARNAWFWSRLLEGVESPWRDLARLGLSANSEAAGVKIAKEKIKAVMDAGIFGGCLIFPFSGRVYPRIPELVSYIRSAAG